METPMQYTVKNKPAHFLTATLDEMITAVKRELAMRKNVYPRRVADGKMKPEAMAREIGVMTDVLHVLDMLSQVNPEQTPETRREFYNDLIAQNSFVNLMMKEYKDLCKDREILSTLAQGFERRIDDLRQERRALQEKLRALGIAVVDVDTDMRAERVVPCMEKAPCHMEAPCHTEAPCRA
jgi:hypothetical protein